MTQKRTPAANLEHQPEPWHENPASSEKHTGRVALVMAASQGLGYASAEALLRHGHTVVFCARRPDRLEEARTSLQKVGNVVAKSVDVSEPDALAGLIDSTVAELGPIATLVVNAGGPPPGGFMDVTPDDWETSYRLTLMSAVGAIQGVVPGMQEARRGRIIVIGSSSVKRPLPNLVLSNVFRPALAGLVKDLAVTLAPTGITVNLVAPGRMETERVADLDVLRAQRRGLSVQEVRAEASTSIPIGRYGNPREFGALVAFLASDAANYITGQTILVDGGMTASLP